MKAVAIGRVGSKVLGCALLLAEELLTKKEGTVVMTLAEMELRHTELLEAVKVAVLAGGDFELPAAEMVELKKLLKKERVAARAGEIDRVKGELALQIRTLVDASNIRTLIDEAVHTVIWERGTLVEGVEAEPKMRVNPVRVGKKAVAKGEGEKKPSQREPKFTITADGEVFSDMKAYLDRYYIATLPADEKPHSHYAKWPTNLAKKVAKDMGHEVKAA